MCILPASTKNQSHGDDHHDSQTSFVHRVVGLRGCFSPSCTPASVDKLHLFDMSEEGKVLAYGTLKYMYASVKKKYLKQGGV